MASLAPKSVLPPRELRIRHRLDVIRDERDAALTELWAAREEIEKLERRIDSRYRALSELKTSREMWRERAQAAEEMLARKRCGKKAVA